MKAKHTLFLFSFLSILLFVSCEQDLIEKDIKDTIYVNHKGAQMPVYIYGNGANNQMLIVIHGGPGGNGLEYRYGEYSDLLESEMLMAYWDQRGQGMSQGKYGQDALSVQSMADDLEAVILAVKKKYGESLQVFLLGHSWGGMLGTQFMIDTRKAKLVSGWIEANGAHDIPLLNKESIKMFKNISTEQISLGNSAEKWQEIKEWAEAVDENNISFEQSGEINSKGYEVEEFLKDDGFIAQGNAGIEDWKIALFSPINFVKSAISGSYTADYLDNEIESTSLSSKLNQITSPCLFIYGKYDFVVPPALGIDAFDKVSSKNKKLLILERSGHSTMDNEPKLFAQAVLDFVQNIPD